MEARCFSLFFCGVLGDFDDEAGEFPADLDFQESFFGGLVNFLDLDIGDGVDLVEASDSSPDNFSDDDGSRDSVIDGAQNDILVDLLVLVAFVGLGKQVDCPTDEIARLSPHADPDDVLSQLVLGALDRPHVLPLRGHCD